MSRHPVSPLRRGKGEVAPACPNPPGPPVPQREVGRRTSPPTLQSPPSYHFMLLRHWSLYDSMWHSPHVVSRLGLYNNEKGKQQLDTLLSKVVPTSCAWSRIHLPPTLDIHASFIKLGGIRPLGGRCRRLGSSGWWVLAAWVGGCQARDPPPPFVLNIFLGHFPPIFLGWPFWGSQAPPPPPPD